MRYIAIGIFCILWSCTSTPVTNSIPEHCSIKNQMSDGYFLITLEKCNSGLFVYKVAIPDAHKTDHKLNEYVVEYLYKNLHDLLGPKARLVLSSRKSRRVVYNGVLYYEVSALVSLK